MLRGQNLGVLGGQYTHLYPGSGQTVQTGPVGPEGGGGGRECRTKQQQQQQRAPEGHRDRAGDGPQASPGLAAAPRRIRRLAPPTNVGTPLG